MKLVGKTGSEYSGSKEQALFDRSVALPGLLVFSASMPLIASAVAVDSPGNPFFIQARIGKNLQTVPIIKYRTYTPEASKNHTEHETIVADPNDARITKVGRFLRRTHLDELGQVLNVLYGDAHAVGMRPIRPQDARHYRRVCGSLLYNQWEEALHEFGPGILSPAHAIGGKVLMKSDEGVVRKVETELEYVTQIASVAEDLRQIAAMPKLLVAGVGSY